MPKCVMELLFTFILAMSQWKTGMREDECAVRITNNGKMLPNLKLNIAELLIGAV